MNSNQLMWKSLQSHLLRYTSKFFRIAKENSNSLALLQPRLINGLKHLNHQKFGVPLLLVCSKENNDYLCQISKMLKNITKFSRILYGGEYHIINDSIILQSPCNLNCPFTSNGQIRYVEWIEIEQLFGCVRIYKNNINLQAGLLHEVNGGTLIIAAKSLLVQPIIWKRLKKFITEGLYEWLSFPNEKDPLPIKIPSLPFKLKLVICGNRESLLSFQELDHETYETALYTEFEEQIHISNYKDMLNWCSWIKTLAKESGLKKLDDSIWPILINESIRYTGDHEILPLCPRWLLYKLHEASIYNDQNLNARSFNYAIKNKSWREGYVNEFMLNEILFKQILIDTKGSVTGQVNGLSLIDIPGHPSILGQPSRITCVVNIGNGEFIDVEKQSDLGGNIHTKGLMILQSYLNSVLELEHQLPFSTSIVFEQSYSEIDGDSASLAELCALISALSNQPVSQQIAVTGSIDQFGNVQPIGGLNEKIEGFFQLCNKRKLTKKQGVIIPFYNIRNLSLNQNIIKSVKEKKFHIWAIKHVNEAIELLTGIVWKNTENNCILKKIQDRILELNKKENNFSLFNCFKWFFIKK